MKLCKKCAHEVEEDAIICPYCGDSFQKKQRKEKRYEKNSEAKEEKPSYMDNGLIRGPFIKWIAIVLCLLTGWLGGHKFYERKYFMGVFYAMTFGIFGIGIVFDLLHLIQKPKYYYVSRIPFIM